MTITCIEIKQLLERLSGVPDIGSRSRKRELCDIKKVYYKLCHEFSRSSSVLASDALGGYTHATALHSVREFHNLFGSKTFTKDNLYLDAKDIIQSDISRRTLI